MNPRETNCFCFMSSSYVNRDEVVQTAVTLVQTAHALLNSRDGNIGTFGKTKLFPWGPCIKFILFTSKKHSVSLTKGFFSKRQLSSLLTANCKRERSLVWVSWLYKPKRFSFLLFFSRPLASEFGPGSSGSDQRPGRQRYVFCGLRQHSEGLLRVSTDQEEKKGLGGNISYNLANKLIWAQIN